MTNSGKINNEPLTLWEKKRKELAIQEISLWILNILTMIALLMFYSPYFISHAVTYYMEIVSYALVPILIIIQLTLAIIRTTLARNYIIIEGIKFGKKVDQLIFIAQKTHFQDRIRLGRRIYAIAALADLGVLEAISHLEVLEIKKLISASMQL